MDDNQKPIDEREAKEGVPCPNCKRIHLIRMTDRAGFSYCFKSGRWHLDISRKSTSAEQSEAT